MPAAHGIGEGTRTKSIAESGRAEGVLDQLKGWRPSEKLRLARLILETVEAAEASVQPSKGSLEDLLGMLKTDAPPPTDDECRAILADELSKKHLK
jgi:hypothetical protein